MKSHPTLLFKTVIKKKLLSIQNIWLLLSSRTRGAKVPHLEQATFSGHFSEAADKRNMERPRMGKPIAVTIKALYGEVQCQDNSK